MSEAETSYEFDPCSIDESDKEEEPVTLDNWKPKSEKPIIIPSKWRQEAIGTNFNQHPGLDELKKINMYLKKKAPDSDIMKAFGINAETLLAIKKNHYDPVQGISLDNQSKIYNEFERLEKRIESLMNGINYMANIMFIDKKEKAEFKKSFRKVKKATPSKKPKIVNNEYCEDFCDYNDEICEQRDDFSPEEE